MKVIAVNGISHTGKTTVCEALIAGLKKRGFRVASVKDIHYEAFAIDECPSSNTFRHRQAGAELVTARALKETDVFYPERLPILELLRHYDHDYVILEGVSDCSCPRILTAFSEQELDERLDGRVVAVSGVYANDHSGEYQGRPIFNVLTQAEELVDLVQARAFAPLPDFDPKCCSACGHSCRELSCLIAQGQAKETDCLLTQQAVELLIDGQPIPMVPFVQTILRNAVLAVAGELNGVAANSELELRFKI